MSSLSPTDALTDTLDGAIAEDRDHISRMPTEVILEVAKFLQAISTRHHSRIVPFKEARVQRVTPGPKGKIWAYISSGKGRIRLNSFQSFACVNKRIYSICSPLLWRVGFFNPVSIRSKRNLFRFKTHWRFCAFSFMDILGSHLQEIRFPTAVPMQLTHWTRNILPNHGHQVRVLKVELSPQWFKKSYDTASIEAQQSSSRRYVLRPRASKKSVDESVRYSEARNWDNLTITTEDFEVTLPSEPPENRKRPQGLCAENFKKVLLQCPNLNSLVIQCPRDTGLRLNQRNMNLLRINLASFSPTIASLHHLESLSITTGKFDQMLSSSIVPMLQYLPLLRIFNLSGAQSNREDDAEKLARALSELQYLTNLSLVDVECLDSSWYAYPGPPSLVKLEISDCAHLGFSHAPSVISAWAPNLTWLSLKLFAPWLLLKAKTENINRLEPRKYRFNLPRLTRLTLWHHTEYHYIECFEECKQIYSLVYHNALEPNWTEFKNFICFSTLPRLQILKFPSICLQLDARTDATREDLMDYCKQNNIRVENLWAKSLDLQTGTAIIL